MQPFASTDWSQSLTISEVAALYGVSLRTLRFYEDKGLLSPARVGTSRHYSSRDRIRLELILKGKRLGFTLQEIERLLAANVSKNAEDSESGSDLTIHLEEGQIRQQLQSLESRREALSTAIVELRETLDRRGGPEERKDEASGRRFRP